jgi:hypothetical protein
MTPASAPALVPVASLGPVPSVADIDGVAIGVGVVVPASQHGSS